MLFDSENWLDCMFVAIDCSREFRNFEALKFVMYVIKIRKETLKPKAVG